MMMSCMQCNHSFTDCDHSIQILADSSSIHYQMKSGLSPKESREVTCIDRFRMYCQRLIAFWHFIRWSKGE